LTSLKFRNAVMKYLVFIVAIPLLITFKYLKTWKAIRYINKLSGSIYNLLYGRFPISGRIKDSETYIKSVKEAILLAIILNPFPTVCTERALAAALIFSLFGLKISLAYGVRFRPYLMHIWIELDDGSILFDSPNERIAFQKIGVIK